MAEDTQQRREQGRAIHRRETRRHIWLPLIMGIVGISTPVVLIAIQRDEIWRVRAAAIGDFLYTLLYSVPLLLCAFGTYLVVMVAVIVAPVGLLIGTVAGYAGGIVDVLLMRLTDIFLAFPRLILALAFVAALGPGIENAIIAIAITAWPPYARMARAETLTVRNADYIAAARIQGAGPVRIISRHIVPMCLSSVIVRLTLDMAGIILTAAGLGFLGLGAQPPLPEWGAMISTGRHYLLDQWWVATMPGLAIFTVSLGFNLLGDGLRDVLDPRSDR